MNKPFQSVARAFINRSNSSHPKNNRRRQRRLMMEVCEKRMALAADLAELLPEGEPPLFPVPADFNLVYQQTNSEGHRTLMAMDPSHPGGATSVAIAALPAEEIIGPDWSPNGNWLLFTSSANQLFVFNAFDGRTLPVVNGSDSPVTGFNPQWVSDRRISFSSFTLFENAVTSLDIFMGDLQLETDHAKLITSTNLTYDPSADFRHAWSPDGTKFVFESSRSGAGDLYLMDFHDYDGVHLPTKVNLTVGRDTANDSDPEFSPDGQQIAFRSSTGNSDIWVMQADGTALRRLTTDLADEESPTWSPDGSQLVFSARTFIGGEIQEHLRIMNADGTAVQDLTASPGTQTLPTWRQTTPPPSDVAVQISTPLSSVEDQTFEIQVAAKSFGIVDSENVTIRVSVDPRMAIDGITDGVRVGDDIEFHVAVLPVGQVFQRTLIVRAFHSGNHLRADVTAELAADNDPELENNHRWDTIDVSPRNNEFANATVISGAVNSLAFANFNANKQANILGAPEPSHANDADGVPIPAASSIWYSWTANNSGTVTFTTKGSRFDTVMAAYFVSGNGILQRVASNDDGDGLSARISFNTFEGETYYIAIDGYNGAQGTGYLSWSATAAEPVTTPQQIDGFVPGSVPAGSSDSTVKIIGSGFSDGSRIYALAEDESPESLRFMSRNFLPTIVRSANELEVEVPARMLETIFPVKFVVVRGNELSNFADFAKSMSFPNLSFNFDFGLVEVIASLAEKLSQGQTGEGEDETEIYRLQGNIQINEYLAVNGSSVVVQFNKTTNSMHVRIREGSIQMTNVPHYNTITLWSGSDFEFDVNGDGELTNLVRANIETPLRDKGIDITVDRAHLLLGQTNDSQGRPIFGVELYGSLQFQQIPGLAGIPLHFDKMILTQNDGLRFSGEIGPMNLTVGGLFKLEDVFLKFEAGPTPQQDGFSGRARVVTEVFTGAGSIGFRNGVLDSLAGELDIPSFTGLPLGPLNVTGGTFDVQNLLDWRNLQIRLGADATIANPVVSKVISLHDVGLFYRLPFAFGGGGTLEIFKSPAASAGIDLDFAAQKFSFGGDVDLLASFPVFDVHGELTASASAAGFNMSGFIEGSVQVPDGNGGLYDVLKACKEVFGLRIGPCVQFPIEVASARIAYQNSQFSFTTSVPLIGKVALKVKQAQGAVQAIVDVFHNIPALPTHFVFGGAGGEGAEGETPSNTIGTFNMPVGSPRLIVSVGKVGDLPLYDLIDPFGHRYSSDEIGAIGGQFFQNEETGDSIYIVENPMAGEWTAVAHDGVTGPLTFEVWGANAAPELSYVDIQPLGDNYQINFQAFDADNDPNVSLYYTTSPGLTNGTLIAEGLLASQVQSYVWNVADGSVPGGKYYIYAIAEDELNSPAVMFSADAVEVIDPLAPDQPFLTQLTAVENAVDVEWEAVSASDLAGYQVWYGIDEGANTNFEHHVDAGNQTSFRLRGLASNTTYAVTVVAYDRSIEADPLNPGQTVPRSRLSVPAFPQTIITGQGTPPTVTFASFSQGAKLRAGSMLKIDWTIAEDTAIDRQQLFYSQDNGATYSILAQYGADVREANWPVPADLPVSQVRFKIVVEDSSGNSAVDETDYSFRSVPAGTLALSASSYQVDEGAKYAAVKIVRSGATNGRVSVHYDTRTVTGQAEATADFAAFWGELIFEDGIAEQTLLIPIVNDTRVEGTESFQLKLSTPGGGAQLSGISTATIAINDDDVNRDTDGDGIDDAVEAQVGDGNQDGIPDSEQANVASYFESGSGRVLTFALGAGKTLSNVQAWAGQVPPQFANAFLGGVSLTIIGATSGEVVPIQIRSTGAAFDTVLMFGSSVKTPAAHWYYFTDNGTTGARFTTDKQASASVKDGGRGDGDQLANGTIQVVLGIGLSSNSSKYHNEIVNLDVNGDEFITALDALIIINELNTGGTRKLVAPTLPLPVSFQYLDTSNDGFMTAIDVLLVINNLNSRGTGEGELPPRDVEAAVDILFEDIDSAVEFWPTFKRRAR